MGGLWTVSPSGEFRESTVLVVAGIALAAMTLGSPPAGAAHGGSQTKDASTQIATHDPAETSSVEVDDGKNCDQSRKRLFVEGEGWIVRRVTTCY